MPVDPHLGRVGEVGADLDETDPELWVPDVEVVDPDPPRRLGELERHHPVGLGPVSAAEHPLELLSRHDGDHPEPASGLGCLDVGTDVIDLAVIPPGPVRALQPQDRDPVVRRERLHRPHEPVADLGEQRRRRDRVPQMPGQEHHHLPTRLQVRHVGVQQHPVHALDLQRHMAVEHLIDIRRPRHTTSVTEQGPAPPTEPNPPRDHPGRGPGGGPALPPLSDRVGLRPRRPGYRDES